MRARKQRGQVLLLGTNWHVRYWEKHSIAGVIQRKRVTHVLGKCTTRGKHPPQDIVDAAAAHMRTVNDCDIAPEQVLSFAEFTETIYLPWVKENHRTSTYRNYNQIWKIHIEPKSGRDRTLKDVRIKHVQTWLNAIGQKDLARNTLARVKSFLSGLFKHAIRLEYYTGPNPARDTGLNPHAARPAKMHAYDFETIHTITALLSEPAATVFYTAAFSGLRRGEIEGLCWEDYRDGKLHVARSIWNGIENLPKTETSAGAVPVIPFLAERLELHRFRCGIDPKTGLLRMTGPIFRNSANHRLSIKNLTDREILPKLNVCQVCGLPNGIPHLKEEHEWVRDPRRPEWKGWHACRRGVASNLYRLGVRSKVIQEIMRHASETTTKNCYIKTTNEDTLAAMTELGKNYSEKTAAQSLPDTSGTLNSGQRPTLETVN
jgi:integrase